MATQIDPRVYGAQPLELPEGQTGVAPQAPYAAPTQVELPERIAPQAQQEGAAAVQEAERPRAGVWQGVQASASQWGTTRVWDYANSPSFAPEQGFTASRTIKMLDLTPTQDEEAYLLAAASEAEYTYRVDRVKSIRKAYQAMGDNPIMAGLTAFADPAYLAIDVASLGVGRALAAGRAGRAIAAASAAGGAYGIGLAEQEVAPVTTGEVVANALLNGAATALFFRGGKAVPKDPDFPASELMDIARRAQPEVAAPGPRWTPKLDEDGRPVVHANGKAVWVRSTEPDSVRGTSPQERTQLTNVVEEANFAPARTAEHPDFVPTSGRPVKALGTAAVFAHITSRADEFTSSMARNLLDKAGPMLDDVKFYVLSDADLAAKSRAAGSTSNLGRPHYVNSENAIYVSHSSDPQTMLHEYAHAATVSKIKYGQRNAGTEHARIVSQLDEIRADARSRVEAGPQTGDAAYLNRYLTQNTEEFVAGLYTGDSSFKRLLAGMKDTAGRSFLGRSIDAVRRLLGLNSSDTSALTRAMGLTDELLDLPGVRSSGDDVFGAPEVVRKVDDLAKKTGDTLAWNMHKDLAKFNRGIADTLVDDPVNMTGDSVVSQKQAIRSGLATFQYAFEDALTKEMAARGFGVRKRIFSPRAAAKAQSDITKDVAMEMLRREQAQRLGTGYNPTGVPQGIREMADRLDDLSKASLEEMQRAGVQGAEAINYRAGYFSRRWDSGKLENVINKLTQGGMDDAAAKGRVATLLSNALRRANGWDKELADDVGRAILDRALRKGEFTDSAFRGHIGNENLAELRDILEGSGIRGDRMQRALDALAGTIDEAGKPAQLKHRLDMDMFASIRMADGSNVQVADLIDTNLANITDRYVDMASGQSALARKGLSGPTEIGKLRAQLVSGIESMAERQRAVQIFDGIIDTVLGRPVGDDMSAGLRKLQAVTQMVGLSSSGLWQLTEYATPMVKYGLMKTMQNVLNTMPGFKGMFDTVSRNGGEAQHLADILARNSSQDIRIRPFVQRLEDNFEIPMSDSVQLALQQSRQLVPYLNAMKFVHHHQARVVANMVTDTFHRGAKGDVKAQSTLQRYGLESHTMADIADDIRQHGLDVERWADTTWDAVRGPLNKMMDESVLRNRTGEIPTFAQFSQVGKFIFTFRSFVLGAHNKLLAGTLGRNGFAGMGLMMLYQFPLAQLAVLADNTIKGREEMTTEELAMRSISQLGSIGLASELWGAMSGEKQQFGAPGLIAIDRLYSAVGDVSSGNFGGAAKDVLNATPLLSLIPGIKAIGETLK